MTDDRYTRDGEGVFGTDSYDDSPRNNYPSYTRQSRTIDTDRIMAFIRGLNWRFILIIATAVILVSVIYINRAAILSAILTFIEGLVSIVFIVVLIGGFLYAVIFPNGRPGGRRRRRW